MPTATRRSPKPKAPTTVATPEGAPEIAAAVSVAVGIMQIAKVATWAELAAVLDEDPERVCVTEEQAGLLERNAVWLPLLVNRPGMVTVATVCDECGRAALIPSSGGSTKAKCNLTWACKGTLFKSGIARRAKPAKAA